MRVRELLRERERESERESEAENERRSERKSVCSILLHSMYHEEKKTFKERRRLFHNSII